MSRIKDPREPGKIKHTITVILFLALMHFIFKLRSRREYNVELTTPSIIEALGKLFPEINTVPHSETIARVLSRIDLNEIEEMHVNMIRKLINKKKFNKFLIGKSLPISIDATQKAVRSGQQQIEGWLARMITTADGKKCQQYLYVLEANITFHNGLTIPLLTEFCWLDTNDFDDAQIKQACELTTFKKLSDKLKSYFPRRKIIVLLDALYPCDRIFGILQGNNWDFMIKLPEKLKALYESLQENSGNAIRIPNQPYYRNREQKYYWKNNLTYKGYTLHTVACNEKWTEVCNETGEIITKYSTHTWVSSQSLSIDKVHLLCNLAARKRAFIEDSFNTEKNRGYQYQHIFSYNWNAIQAFHLLMRLAHAVNAISEFTKNLKMYVKDLGCSNTLKKIFDGLKHLWLSDEWFKKQSQLKPRLCFQFE